MVLKLTHRVTWIVSKKWVTSKNYQKSLKKAKIRSICSILDPPRYYSTDLFRLKSPKSRSIRVMLL